MSQLIATGARQDASLLNNYFSVESFLGSVSHGLASASPPPTYLYLAPTPSPPPPVWLVTLSAPSLLPPSLLPPSLLPPSLLKLRRGFHNQGDYVKNTVGGGGAVVICGPHTRGNVYFWQPRGLGLSLVLKELHMRSHCSKIYTFVSSTMNDILRSEVACELSPEIWCFSRAGMQIICICCKNLFCLEKITFMERFTIFRSKLAVELFIVK